MIIGKINGKVLIDDLVLREEPEVLTRWQDPTIEEKNKEIERLNNIINKSIEAINTYQDSKTFGINYENIRIIRGILKGNEFDIRVFENHLKELKEGKNE